MQFYSKAMLFGPIVVVTTASPLTTAEVGAAYSTTIGANGGVGPYTFAITSGSLPAGLNLASNGVISGTPTTTQVTFPNISATDSLGHQSASKAFSMTVVSAVSITTTSPLPNATQSTAYSFTMAATGGVTPYVWSLLSQTGSNGWSVSPSGVVSGTPGTIETDTLDIQVVDALGVPSAANFNLTVNSASGQTFDYYISTTGSDANVGSLAAPWAITSLQDTNGNNSKIAGKKVGLIAGTFDISSLTGNGNYQDPLLHLPAGSAVASTIIASCNSSGIYTARASVIKITSASSTVNSVIGQDTGNNGYFTIDGIVFDGGGTYPGTTGFSGGSIVAYFPSGLSAGPAVFKNCEWTNLVSNTVAGNNVAYIFMQVAGNYLITNNYFHDTTRGANGSGDVFHQHCIENYGCNGGVISFNTFYNAPYFIDMKVNDANISVYGNYFGKTISAASAGPAALMGFDGDQFSQSNVANVIHHNVFDSCRARINDVSSSILQNITFYNNTVYSTLGSPSIADLRCTSAGNVLVSYNNIFVSTAGGGGPAGNYSTGPAANISISNYNCFALSSLTAGWGQGYPSGATYNTLAAWQAFTGSPDAQSIASSSISFPQFTGTITTGNGPAQYQLGGASPCLNAGKTGGTSGGTTVNMGAWDGTYSTIGADWVSYPVS